MLPRIIQPEEHPVRCEMIDDNALHVMRTLNRAGYASYLVGGGVRDLYLGKPPKDFDISTDARPGQVRRLFANSRTIGRRFRLVQVFFKNNEVVEVSTLRSLSEHDLDGPQAVLVANNTYGTLDQDAQRRDLSINGLFFEIENRTIIDYVGGIDDLDRGIIRIIGDPDKRINRDPVRMMRVIRHCARSGFTVENRSWQAVCDNSDKLKLCPPSRLRDELFKDLYGGSSSHWFPLAVTSGLFGELFNLYKNHLNEPLPNGSLCRDQLQDIFTTIDRLNNTIITSGGHRHPAHITLSLILLPWAVFRFDLFNRSTKGAQLNHLARQVHDELAKTLVPQLNLRRSFTREIITLVTHLPILDQHRRHKSWPKWLKRKSYFHSCHLLHSLYREATEHIPTPQSLILSSQTAPIEQKSRSRKKRSGRKGRPALSNNPKSSIFGLKR